MRWLVLASLLFGFPAMASPGALTSAAELVTVNTTISPANRASLIADADDAWAFGTVSGEWTSVDIGGGDKECQPTVGDPAYLLDGAPDAYAQALAAHLGNTTFSDEARAEVLDLVDTTVLATPLSGANQCILEFGLSVPVWIETARLLEDTPASGWDATDTANFQAWLVAEVYPLVDWSSRNRRNNWGAAGSLAAYAIAKYVPAADLPAAEHVTMQLDRIGNTELFDADCVELGIQSHGGIPEELRRGDTGCSGTYLLDDTTDSLLYQCMHTELLVFHAEMMKRLGDTTLYSALPIGGMPAIQRAIRFVIANPSPGGLSWTWRADRFGGLLTAATHYNDTDIKTAALSPTTFRGGRTMPYVRVTNGAPANIVVLLLDDWGYEHYSASFTPNINTLAASGINFNRFSAEANCSPTRVALLTGRHPFRTGVGTVVGAAAATNRGLEAAEPNILHALNGAGYRTVGVGKLHTGGVGNETDLLTYPNRLGFSSFTGLIGNVTDTVTGTPASGTYTSYELIENGSASTQTTYLTTRTIDDAIAALDGSAPFFLYVALNAPHTPYHCPPNTLTPTYDAICTPIGGESQDIAHFKAMLEAADGEIARLLTAIDNGPGWETTTLFVVGDNGPEPNVIPTDPAFNVVHGKGTIYRQGVNTPLLVRGSAVASTEFGTTGSQNIQIHDLSATILDLAGLGAGVATGAYKVTDGIPITSYLTASDAATIRSASYAEVFAPNGLPYNPTFGFDQVGTAWPYRRLYFAPGNEEFYESVTDEHEASALDTMSLTAPEQAAYDLLEDTAHFPTDGPTPIANGRSLR